MAKLGINTGSIPNDGTGDTLLAAALKINQNFDEIYSAFGNGTNISASIAYALNAGVSTYASISGISSASQGLTGTPNINVGVTSASSLNVSGSVGIGTTNASSKLTVRGGDISVGVSTSHGVILTSPNGTQYRLIVANNGTLSTVAV